MDGLDTRERRLLRAYCLVTVLATLAWWIGLCATDTVRSVTIGSAIDARAFAVFLPGDLLSAGLLPLAVLFARSRAMVSVLLWIHFGGQGYAFLLSVGLAVFDPDAYCGMVTMMLSAAAALGFALRHAALPILWGPFTFAPSQSLDTGVNWRKTLLQTGAMWLTFLLAIPAAIVLLETWFHWRQPWSLPLWFDVVMALVFVAAGSTGIVAGRCFVRDGDGTPLPANGTRRLVTSGPYRWVRNPMAALGILQGVCVGLLLHSPLVVVYAVTGGLWWEVLVRPLEESYLTQTFGDEYRAFCSRVRCWVPRIPRAAATVSSDLTGPAP